MTLTRQEIFDRVAAHLLQQGERSIRGEMPYAGDCMYRGDRGLRCAIGALIPDDQYYEELEFLAADDADIVRVCNCSLEDRSFLKQLQDLHDTVDPQCWLPALLVLTAEHDLSPAAVLGGLMDGPDMMPTPKA